MTIQQLGMNLSVPARATINKVKQGEIWAGTRVSDSARVTGMSDIFNLDGNGYPTDMLGHGSQAGQTMSSFDFVTMKSLTTPYFKSGHWVLLWSGTAAPGKFTVREDFNGSAFGVISSAANRIVVDIPTPSAGGVGVTITGIDGSSTLTELSLVHEDYESSYNFGLGEVVDPDFFNKFQYFSYRFMDWFETNTNTNTGYPLNQPGEVFWNAIPVEFMCALCNKSNKNGWFTLPILIDDPNVIELSTRIKNGHTDTAVHQRTWSGLSNNCYVEDFNEAWNAYGYPPNTEMRNRGTLMFPSVPNSDTGYNFYFMVRTAQTENIFKDVWTQAGQGSRVIRVSGNQMTGAGIPGTAAAKAINILPTDNGGLKFTANCSITGTTLTIVNSFSGTTFDPTATLGGQYGGQLVQGTGVDAQTYIVSNIAGTGNGSTWTVSKDHTGHPTGTVAMTGTYWPDGQTNGAQTDVIGIAPYFNVPNNLLPLSDVNDLFAKQDGIVASFRARIDNGTPGIAGTVMTVIEIPGGSGIRPAKGYPITPNGVVAGFVSGTKIVDQVSHTGTDWCREGVYTVDTSQTVADPGVGNFNLLAPAVGVWEAISIFRQTQLSFNEYFGKNTLCYEGGQGNMQGWGNSSDISIALAAKSDSRMYNDYTTWLTYLNTFTTAAGEIDVLCHFNDVGPFTAVGGIPPGSNGNWGCIPNTLTATTDPSAYEYNALVAFLGPSPPPGPSPSPSPSPISHGSGKHVGRPRKIPHI